MAKAISERTLLFLLGAIQFVNVLDFMMVTPLGPDFARDLGIPNARLGMVTGSYAASASLAGLLGTLFLDRFDRRSALGVALAGLVIGTAAGGLAVGLKTLVLARLIAGMFGGPATSLALSILSDLVPVERRGRAFGAVMGAFSVASVIGVPVGLLLARHGGWRVPFFGVAALGMTLGAACVGLLPPVRGHLERLKQPGQSNVSLLSIISRKEVRLSLTAIACTMMAGFLIIPNFPAYLQFNCGVPRWHMDYLFAIGGVCSFITMRFVGKLVDRHGSPTVAVYGTLLFLFNIVVGYLFDRMLLPAELVMAIFMIANATRNIAATTLSSRVPQEHERARYQSMLSAVQHIASAIGAFLGALILTELPDHRLSGIPQLAVMALFFGAMHPILMKLIEQKLRLRDAAGQNKAAT